MMTLEGARDGVWAANNRVCHTPEVGGGEGTSTYMYRDNTNVIYIHIHGIDTSGSECMCLFRFTSFVSWLGFMNFVYPRFDSCLGLFVLRTYRVHG